MAERCISKRLKALFSSMFIFVTTLPTISISAKLKSEEIAVISSFAVSVSPLRIQLHYQLLFLVQPFIEQQHLPIYREKFQTLQ